jgi:hypothetical protein
MFAIANSGSREVAVPRPGQSARPIRSRRRRTWCLEFLPIEAATLPEGWDERAVKVQNKNTRDFIGWCIEAHDLAASKLVAFREKDREFVRVLLVEKMVTPRKLTTRIRRRLRVSCRSPVRAHAGWRVRVRGPPLRDARHVLRHIISVTMRRQEIGIRIALGAQRGDVLSRE